MALRNAILLGLKNPMVYQKCLEENQHTLTALLEELQKQESKTRQEQKVQTNSSTWLADTTSGRK